MVSERKRKNAAARSHMSETTVSIRAKTSEYEKGRSVMPTMPSMVAMTANHITPTSDWRAEASSSRALSRTSPAARCLSSPALTPSPWASLPCRPSHQLSGQ